LFLAHLNIASSISSKHPTNISTIYQDVTHNRGNIKK